MGDNLRRRAGIHAAAESALREASEANALSGSDEHVIQGEGIICSLVRFIPLDVFGSTVEAVSLQEMKVVYTACSSICTPPRPDVAAGRTVNAGLRASDFGQRRCVPSTSPPGVHALKAPILLGVLCPLKHRRATGI